MAANSEHQQDSILTTQIHLDYAILYLVYYHTF